MFPTVSMNIFCYKLIVLTRISEPSPALLTKESHDLAIVTILIIRDKQPFEFRNNRFRNHKQALPVGDHVVVRYDDSSPLVAVVEDL